MLSRLLGDQIVPLTLLMLFMTQNVDVAGRRTKYFALVKCKTLWRQLIENARNENQLEALGGV